MFSVIIPLYNKAQFIKRAIESVLNQEYQEYEIILINDGSSDGGVELVEKEFSDKVLIINQTNAGVSIARNKGIKHAKYPWIAFLDADDYWHPSYLSFAAQTIHENPKIGIIGTHYDSNRLTEKPELKYFKLDKYFKLAIENILFFTSATVLKKSFFESNPGFDPDLKLGEDIDVWLRASIFFGDGVYIQNTLVHYEKGDIEGATKKDYFLEETLIPKLFNENYFQKSRAALQSSFEDFEIFKIKWIYFTLFPLFRKFDNKNGIRNLLKKMPPDYFLVRTFYKLPFWLLHILFQSNSFSKLFRNYLKFCFRFIYK